MCDNKLLENIELSKLPDNYILVDAHNGDNGKIYVTVQCKNHPRVVHTSLKYKVKTRRSNICSTCGFINKAVNLHGDAYKYHKVDYVNAHSKVVITCEKHGDFLQTPNAHLTGSGCTRCSNKGSRLSTAGFIERAEKTHGKLYDYSSVEYLDGESEVIIGCKIHGDFLQYPRAHIQGKGCLYCRLDEQHDRFIEKSIAVHGSMYEYDAVEYVHSHKEVVIKCKIHGQFLRRPSMHVYGSGCPKCRINPHNK